ncbi:MAG: DUF1295 domain-containing protein [Halioglobus sp.]
MKAIFIIHLLACVVALAGSQSGLWINTPLFALPIMAAAVLLAMALQWLAFLPAYKYQTERYYDLIGSLTFISVTLFALFCAAHFDGRSLLLAGAIVLWASRLGSHLFVRILQDGSDSRFDKIKPSKTLFFRTWSLQGLWVTVTAGAALAAIGGAAPAALGWLDVFAVAVFLGGFVLETLADTQKRRFRAAHGSGQFITTGVWAWSRHPNYVGEITLWLGIALLAMPALHGWQFLTLISPVFVYLLLTRVSGVPLLERKADLHWGEDPQYLAYKRRTPVLFPWSGH